MKWNQWMGGIMLMVMLLLVMTACVSTQQGAQVITPIPDESQAAWATPTRPSGTDSSNVTTPTDAEDADSSATANTPRPTSTVAAGALPDSEVIFRLNDTIVTVGDFRDYMKRELAGPIAAFLAQGQTPDAITMMADEQDVRNTILENMIREEVLVQEAIREGVGVDANAVDEEIEQLRLSLETGGEEVPDEVELRKEVTRQILAREMIARHTTADMFLSRHILVTDTTTAEEISQTLADGSKTFDELAKEFSQDPGSKETGGSYGWIPRGSFVPEYEDAAFNAPLNVPVIITTTYGVHLLIIEDRENDRAFADFEELRNSPNAPQYVQDSFEPWYTALREAATKRGDLEINEAFDPNTIPLPFPDDVDSGAGVEPTAPARRATATSSDDADAEPTAPARRATATPTDEEDAEPTAPARRATATPSE